VDTGPRETKDINAIMDDFNSETDSDYTSYWRDWVGSFSIWHRCCAPSLRNAVALISYDFCCSMFFSALLVLGWLQRFLEVPDWLSRAPFIAYLRAR